MQILYHLIYEEMSVFPHLFEKATKTKNVVYMYDNTKTTK